MRVLSMIKSVVLPLGLLVIGVFVALTAFAEAPADPVPPNLRAAPADYTGDSGTSLADAALSDFNVNEAAADNVYQQQVVAGWATKDLLWVLSTQAADQQAGLTAINDNLKTLVISQQAMADAAAMAPPIDDRPRQLIALGVGAVCWLGMWSVVPPTKARRRPETVAMMPAPEAAVSAGEELSTD